MFANDMGEFDEAGVEGSDAALGEIFEEAAEGNEVVGLGDGLEVFSVTIFFAVKAEAEFTHELLGNVGGSEVAKIGFGVGQVGFGGDAELGLFFENI